MFKAYSRLWAIPAESLSSATIGLLLGISLALPLLIGLAVDNVWPLIITVACGVGIIAVILLLEVELFFTLLFPVAFIIASHHLLLLFLALLILSLIINRLSAYNLSVLVPFPLILLLLVISSVIGFMHAFNPVSGAYCLRYLYLYPIVAFIVVYNISPSTRHVGWNLMIFSVIASLIGFSGIVYYLRTGLERQIPGWHSQNLVANFFGIMLPFTLLQLIDSDRWWKRGVWAFIFTGILAGIFVTQTRAVILSSMVAVLYLAWHDRRVLKIFTPALVVGIVVAPALILTRIQMFLGKGSIPDWSTIGRIEVWTNSWNLIKTSYINGLGLDSFRYIYPIKYPNAFLPAEHPHNSIWKWWFDIGIYGLFAYCLVIVNCWRRSGIKLSAPKSREWNAESRLLLAINAGIISVLIAATMDVPLHNPHVVTLFWIFLAYQLLLGTRVTREAE
ncbi:MAG: O-antigen ligase family protein [Calditrichota bacterium]